MFDNVAFEVVIGLVFMYLLYSLLVTIVGELISTWMGIRARILRVAIERMLNDGYYKKMEEEKWKIVNVGFKVWFWITDNLRGFFLYEHKEFKHSFAGRFYNYPSIKYLAKLEADQKGIFGQTKPSYITAENFAVTLINFLSSKGVGKDQIEQIAFCLKFNTQHIQPETAKNFRDLLDNSSNDINTFRNKLMKWFDETMDRASGWYKRKVGLILFWLGFLIAAAFNVDSIKIAQILANDKEARNQLVTMGVELAKDSSRYDQYVHINGDSVHAKAIIDTGYNRITKDLNEANLVIGLGWNLDKLQKNTVYELERDDDSASYDYIAASLTKLDYNNLKKYANTLQQQLKDTTTEINSLKRAAETLTIDTALLHLKSKLEVNADSLNRINTLLVKETAQIDSLKHVIDIKQNGISKDSVLLADIFQKLHPTEHAADSLTGNRFVVIDSMKIIPGDEAMVSIYGKRYYNILEKCWYVIKNIPASGRRLLGFILTAFALSLGAPFWFGVLNKLVAIRGAGVKPEEKKENALPVKGETAILQKRISDVSTPDVISDFIEQAIADNAASIRKIPGVKTIFSVVKNADKILQINVDSEVAKAEVIRRFPKITVGEVNVPYDIIVSGKPVTHVGSKGIISNISGKNGFGSAGLMLQRKDTGSIHVLSCWHVMKGDTNYSLPDDFTTILDHAKNNYAERWAGGIFEQFDYGIASRFKNVQTNFNSVLKNELGLPSKIEFRDVHRKDVEDQISIKYYDSINAVERKGFIYADTKEIDITYLDKIRTIKDVLILTGDDGVTISKEGNSGSIIFDENNFAIAMIISGDLFYTYAVKLSYIFRIHNEMIIA